MRRTPRLWRSIPGRTACGSGSGAIGLSWRVRNLSAMVRVWNSRSGIAAPHRSSKGEVTANKMLKRQMCGRATSD